MPRVLLVDDDEDLLDSLGDALVVTGLPATRVRTGAAAIAEFGRGTYEVVVLDLSLPDIHGHQVLQTLRRSSAVPVLVLTGSDRPESRVAALDAGADDFLGKPFDMAELSARLRALLRRPDLASETLVRTVDNLRIDLRERRLTVAGAEVRLTPKEWAILGALTERAGLLVQHGALVKAAWGETHGDETRESLRVHMRSLRRKLGDDAQHPRFIRTESAVGYRWLPHFDGDAASGVEEARKAEALSQGPNSECLHDLDNVLTALEVVSFILTSAESSAASSTMVQHAVSRLPSISARLRALIEEVVGSRPIDVGHTLVAGEGNRGSDTSG